MSCGRYGGLVYVGVTFACFEVDVWEVYWVFKKDDGFVWGCR